MKVAPQINDGRRSDGSIVTWQKLYGENKNQFPPNTTSKGGLKMAYRPRNERPNYKVNRKKMSEKICDVEAEGTLNKTSNTWSIRQQQQKNQLNYIRIGDFYSTKVL